MSVLELTISYTKSVVEGEFDTPFFSVAQKKQLIIGTGILLIAITSFYLYMTGVIVSTNLERQHLESQLKTTLSGAQAVERQALTQGRVFTAQYFIDRGYEEPSDLGIIKRTSNVAEISSHYFY